MKSLKHKVQVASSLSLSDWLALLEAWYLLPVFALILRWMSYEHLSLMLERTQKISFPHPMESAQRVGKAVTFAAHFHFLCLTCLARATTLTWMLNRRGIPAYLRIGARKVGVEIHAHAWVEVQGQIIAEPEDNDEKFHLLISNTHSLSDRFNKSTRTIL